MNNKRIAQAQKLIKGYYTWEVFESEQDRSEFKVWYEEYHTKGMARNDRIAVIIIALGMVASAILTAVQF